MDFNYEIAVDDYVACQLLYYKATVGTKRILHHSIGWILLGLFLIVVAWNASQVNWPAVLLAFNGGYWMYVGTRAFFPARYFRRHYPSTNLRGKKFEAVVTEQGIQVTGDLTYTMSRWDDVTVRAEDEKAFMFYSEGTATIFMFGKKYLTREQQHEMSNFIDSEPASTA